MMALVITSVDMKHSVTRKSVLRDENRESFFSKS